MVASATAFTVDNPLCFSFESTELADVQAYVPTVVTGGQRVEVRITAVGGLGGR